MPVDRSALDEAVRRFPAVVHRYPSLLFFISNDEFAAICREYRLILAERAKQRRKAA